MLDRVASMAATEVLTEVRSSVHPRELLLPLDVEDAATFYYNEKQYTDCIRSSSSEAVGPRNVGGTKNGGTLVLLGPGAKMMLRLHLFELMNKLALYEQV